MNLLARLMSHGFAIALVLLLAVGFIYRGELFPEWELPEFLAFDSAKDSDSEQLAGKIQPAPIPKDGMSPGAATVSKGISAVGTDGVPVTIPQVEAAAVAGGGLTAERAPDVAEAVAESVVDVVDETEDSEPVAA